MFYVMKIDHVRKADGTPDYDRYYIMDTSDGVAEWLTDAEYKDATQRLGIPIFKSKYSNNHMPTSGVFNKTIASILLTRGISYLCDIKSEQLSEYGWVTETCFLEDYTFYGCIGFEYLDWRITAKISTDMCTVQYILSGDIDYLRYKILPPCVSIIDNHTVAVTISTDILVDNKQSGFKSFEEARAVVMG